MYGADEKKAFEAMMAEIEDSDEDENLTYGARSMTKPSSRHIAESKAVAEPSPYGASAKSSASANISYQNSQSFQMSKQDEEIAKFGIEATQTANEVQSEQINITKRWLTRSCSYNERNSMKCFVERERSTFGMQTTYRCYLEGSGGADSKSDGSASSGARFLMSAKKKVVNKTSYYLISLDPDASDDRGSETILGKVSTQLS